MSQENTEVVTVLTLELPSDVARGVGRHTRLRGVSAIEMSKLIGDQRHSNVVLHPEEGPSDLASAVEQDIEEVLASIPPQCPICAEEFDAPHPACEQRVLDYLRLS